MHQAASIAARAIPVQLCCGILISAACGGTATQEPAAAIRAETRTPDWDDQTPSSVPMKRLSMTIEPTRVSMAAGDTTQLSAILHLPSGHSLHVTPAWSTSDAAIVTIEESGLATAVARGRARAFATYFGLKASSDISVADPMGSRMMFTVAGCYPSGSVIDAIPITIRRPGPAGYVGTQGEFAVCAADQLRVSPSGALIEPSRTNDLFSPNDFTDSRWVKRGTCTATHDGTNGPDGGTPATLISGVGTRGNDFYQIVGGVGASQPLATSLWIKRVSTSGTITVDSSFGAAFGRMTIDLAMLPADWVRIGADRIAGVTLVVPFTSTASAQAGFQVNAGATGPLSFYVANAQQEVGSYASSYVSGTRPADVLNFANPLSDADRDWCVDAGLWSLGSGVNSAGLTNMGGSLVFSVIDEAGATKSVTTPSTYIRGPHRLVACDAQGTLGLYVDGLQMGIASGTGTGIITRQPATLSITDSMGPVPSVAVAPVSDPAAVGQRSSPSLVVALAFDDGNQDLYDYAAPALEAHGMRGTFYVISDKLDSAPGYFMGMSEVRSLYLRGHEIGGHTLTHQNLSLAYIPLDRMKREICDSRARWISQGIPVASLAYPWSTNDSNASSLARACGYSTARIVGASNNGRGYCGTAAMAPDAPYYDTIPPIESPVGFRVHTAAVPFGNTCTLADLKNVVTDAELHLPAANGRSGVLVLLFHHVCPGGSCGTPYAVDSILFSSFLDWLDSRGASGTVVRTMSEAFAGPVNPPVASGTPAVINGDFESYIREGSTGAPDCWKRDADVGTTATWSRVPGQTGFAQQVVAPSLTIGSHVRLMQDSAGLTACNVPTTAGHTYTFTCSYKSDVPLRIDVRRLLDANKSFPYWTQSATTFPASPSDWAQATWTTPEVSAGVIALGFGVAISDGACASACLNGDRTATMIVDDCFAVEN